MHKRWHFKQLPEPDLVRAIEQELKVSPLMATLLAQRKLIDRKAVSNYFEPLVTQLHDPFLMQNMDRAAERVLQAIRNKEKVMVYGDYDVDGTTAVTLVYSVLRNYLPAIYYIPDRYEEGYGLSFKGVDTASEEGVSLLIALDCGIKEVEKVAYAREKGIDVIVCDHHTPGEIVPDCIVLDPKQEDCQYPYPELCGCGVGFKLMQALFTLLGGPQETLYGYLDLVAIAIGADIVPVTGENRVLCKLGLDQLNNHPRPGIEALLKQALKPLPVNLSTVVFTVAPRINAAGRLESGMRSVELLLTERAKEAETIAKEIDDYNQDRKLLDARITEEALDQIMEDGFFANRKSTVVFHKDWHKGVVGIVASRLIESHYRPTIVLTESKGLATGSARSVERFNVYEAISACAHLLTQFGGHQHAAGLTMPLENVDAFREAFDQYVQQNLEVSEEIPELGIDLEIRLHQLFNAGESVAQVPRVMRMLERMEPFGPGNDKPVFCVRSVYARSYRILKEAHLRVEIMDPATGIVLPAIGFNLADKADLVAAGCAFDCAFTLETNTWNDKTTLQLQIRDLRETV